MMISMYAGNMLDAHRSLELLFDLRNDLTALPENQSPDYMVCVLSLGIPFPCAASHHRTCAVPWSHRESIWNITPLVS